MEYWKLFLAFFRIGIFGYGGGPSMIPLFHAECVKNYKWVTAEEFADYLALGNALPGPIATKMASYIGYRVKGWLGAFIAIIAVSFPVLIAMIFLLSFVNKLKGSSYVNGMIQAIQPVIGVMMAVLAYEFIMKGWKGAGNKIGIVSIIVISLIALVFFNIHPGILVGLALVGAFVYSTRIQRAKRKDSLNKGV
ncbi:chromate transporter [Aneurinibacillus sp. Ricciae_BoGa-3]|uniref:chromate transporter n=1 Tax=Aneurinibacillus sp. Ricciae_BoGa-3 TaxID=3022697 RepID=UPI002342160E|nr:chromate transporter [Aneurinibacillus sp. Ricciae_BoGa-3]WCK54539.1 chromate transporter [Aneurinibacillus sp. Ricciae_BoGa-3]